MSDNNNFYNEYLKTILDRWTREIERSIWAGHYESEIDKINLCFDIANNKARELYGIQESKPSENIVAFINPDVECDTVPGFKLHEMGFKKYNTPSEMLEPVVESITEPEVVQEVLPEIKDEPIKRKTRSNYMERFLNHVKKPSVVSPDTIDIPVTLKDKGMLIPIDDLPIVNLSLKSDIHNILHTANIKTLKQLTSLSQSQIEKIMYFREERVLELILELNKLGLEHNFSLSKGILAEILPNAKIMKEKKVKEKPEPAPEIVEEWVEIDNISDLEFSPRVHGRLKVAEIYTIDDLLSKSTSDLLSIPYFGHTHLQVIIDELDESNIKHSFKIP